MASWCSVRVNARFLRAHFQLAIFVAVSLCTLDQAASQCRDTCWRDSDCASCEDRKTSCVRNSCVSEDYCPGTCYSNDACLNCKDSKTSCVQRTCASATASDPLCPATCTFNSDCSSCKDEKTTCSTWKDTCKTKSEAQKDDDEATAAAAAAGTAIGVTMLIFLIGGPVLGIAICVCVCIFCCRQKSPTTVVITNPPSEQEPQAYPEHVQTAYPERAQPAYLSPARPSPAATVEDWQAEGVRLRGEIERLGKELTVYLAQPSPADPSRPPQSALSEPSVSYKT